jgi:hypothetical protein
MPVREEVVSWLEEGKADLRHARRSLEIGDYNWACFAAQQSRGPRGLREVRHHDVCRQGGFSKERTVQ